MDKNCKLNPYIKLIRIPDEDVERILNIKQNKPPLSSSCDEPIVIKQELEDNSTSYLCVADTEENFEITEERTWIQQTVHEFRNNIKIEPDDNIITDIKLEPIDTYESITISNYIENFPQQFNCDECNEIFNDSNQLIIHKNFKHKNKPHVCEICNERFILSAHLNLHLIKHVDYRFINKNLATSSLPLKIQSSPKNNSQKKGLKSIQISSKSNAKNNNQQQNVFKKSTINNCNNFKIDLQNIRKCKPFKCPNCTFGTKSEAKFVDHDNYCNISKNNLKDNLPSNCHLCDKQFISQTALNGHMRYHSLRGEITSKRQHVIQNMINNEESKQSPKIYTCKHCARQFMSLSKLKVHYSQHRKKMICNVCNKQFFLKKYYEKHMQMHKDLTIINDNENSLNTQYYDDSLKQKMTRKKIIKCKFTSKFANSQKKNYPLKKITDFKCLLCNSYYKSRKTYLAHNRQFHRGQQPLKSPCPKEKCDWCNMLITKPNLPRHIKAIHPNVKSVKCLYCSVTFKDCPSRKLHISECHKK